jgi:hypothetical protein
VNPSEARRPAAAGDSAGGETQLFFVDTAGDVEPQSQTARNVARLILGVESVPAAEEEENNKDERDEADGDDDDDAASGSSGAVPAVRAAGTNKKKAAVADEADDVEDAQALLKALPELPHEVGPRVLLYRHRQLRVFAFASASASLRHPLTVSALRATDRRDACRRGLRLAERQRGG